MRVEKGCEYIGVQVDKREWRSASKEGVRVEKECE